jgi:hypothetical protein
MSKTVTGVFDSIDKARNAKDDLVSTGIPREKVYLDNETNQVKVITPAETEAEILEVLNRHEPTQVTST